MLEVIAKNGQFHFNIEDNSLLLKKCDDLRELTELADGLYLLDKLIIENMTVIREVKTDIKMDYRIKVPPFDMEKLPFVIAMKYAINGNYEFFLVNIKTGTS